MFDLIRRSVVNLDTLGHRVAEQRYPLPFEPAAATYVAAYWFVAGRDRDGHPLVMRLAETSATQLPLPARLRHDLEHEWHLSAGNEGLLITQITSPFEVTELDINDGRVIARFAPTDPAVRLGDDSWVSMAVVRIGDGYLQTLADQTTDRRLIIVYDNRHRVRTMKSLTAPFGIVSSSPEKGVLVGGRWTKGPEYVLYTWNWIDSTSTF